MKRALNKIEKPDLYWINKEGKIIEGANPNMTGDFRYVFGNCTDVWGNLSDIQGDLTYIRGNLTGIRGNLDGRCGNLDDCEITDEERAEGIDISDLIK